MCRGHAPIDYLVDSESRVLINIIEQIADLSKHAANMIGEIGDMCEDINKRTKAVVDLAGLIMTMHPRRARHRRRRAPSPPLL